MAATFYGFNPPFIGGPQHVLSRQEDIKLISNDILQLWNTIPGERVMRPTYGVNLRNFVFEPMIDADIDALATELRQSIVAYEPRVTTIDIIIQKDINQHGLNIHATFALKRDPQKEIVIDRFIKLGT